MLDRCSLVPRLPTFHTASDDKSLGRPGYEVRVDESVSKWGGM